MPDERLQIAPGHKLAVLAVVATEAAREQPPEPRPEARVNPGNAPGALVTHKLDLTSRDEPRRVDVDQAAIQHVGAQQHLTRPSLELGEIELRRRPRRRRLESLHPVDRDEQLAPADPRLETDHGRPTPPPDPDARPHPQRDPAARPPNRAVDCRPERISGQSLRPSPTREQRSQTGGSPISEDPQNPLDWEMPSSSASQSADAR